MKVVVLGATGNVGSRVVAQAASAGHEVVAFARRPQAVVAHPNVTVVAGSLEDSAALADAARGADVLVVAVTGSMREATFMQQTIPVVASAAKDAQVGRVVLVSAFGAGDSAQKASGFARLIYRTALSKFFADKAAADALLQDSGLVWSIVYPVNLKDKPASGQGAAVKPLTEFSKVSGLPSLSFDDAAAAILRVVTDSATAGQRLVIAPSSSLVD